MITIEQKDNKTHLKYKESSIKLLNLEDNLYRMRIDDIDKLDKEENSELKNYFLNHCKEHNITIITEDYKPENLFLTELGFQIFRSKNLYNKKLVSIEPVNESLIFKSLKEVTEPIFIDYFTKALEGYEETDGQTEIDYFQSMKETAGEKYHEEWWKVAFQNETPIGVILPQIFEDSEIEGTMLYIGFFPEFRSKGLGRELHKNGLNFLKEYGATDYIGSTLFSNKSMNNIFLKNNCEKTGVQNFFCLQPI